MIELSRDDSPEQYSEVWADADLSHVIVHETEAFDRGVSGEPGWYVRDEDGEEGPFPTLDLALEAAHLRWGGVSLAPANRLRRDIEDGDENDGMRWLVEYLATYGTADIDAQELARRVSERLEV